MSLIQTVIESVQVSQVVDLESSLYPRMEEAFDALKWWLARKPESGSIVDDYYWVYKQLGDRDLNIPVLVVLYTFDANDVQFFSLLVKLPTLD